METLKSIIEGVVVTAMLAGAYSIGVSVGQEVTRHRARDDDISMEHKHGGDDP